MRASLKILVILCLCSTAFFSMESYSYNGKLVADELNALYSKAGQCKNNEPDYYCSGIILHIFDYNPNRNDHELWYLPAYRNVGSFSYIRHDLIPSSGKPLFIDLDRDTTSKAGVILTTLDDTTETHQFSYKVYCEYPRNGLTDGRPENGCGFEEDQQYMFSTKSDYSTCSAIGINSAADYINEYTHDEVLKPPHEDHQITLKTFNDKDHCSFSPDKNGFELSMNIWKYLFRDTDIGCARDKALGYEEDCEALNELVVSSWPREKIQASAVPIKAFFMVINASSGKEKIKDKERLGSLMQLVDNYSKATNYNRRIPVVLLDYKKLKAGDKDIFLPAIKQ